MPMLSPIFRPQLLPTPTLAEQVVAAELAYHRQPEQCMVTEADRTNWHHKQAFLPAAHAPVEGYLCYAFVLAGNLR